MSAWCRLGLCAALAAAACGDDLAGDDRQGGDTTVDDRTQGGLLHPAANLTADQREVFQAGRGPFDFHWEPPALGPLFNNDACFGCHGSNGRGLALIGTDDAIGINGPVSQALVRVSLPEGTPDVPGGPVPVPGLGLQLQDHATTGLPEGFVTLAWRTLEVMYGDGEVVALREPVVDVRSPDGRALPTNLLTSFRTAPALPGMGLLAAVDDATLRALADPDDADGDGVSGRINAVWDPIAQATVVGRFGWKANAPSLAVQVAGAFVNDMGLTSKTFPEPDGMTDVPDDQLANTIFMVSTIAVPAAGARGAAELRGRDLFRAFGCASCHVPTLVTGDADLPQLAHQTIHPYTDLLLHDMGDRLTDARPDFQAAGVEWRTPALWGIGLATAIDDRATFLHDGRARSLAEAILWHGGEAMAAREAFRTATAAERAALVAFVSSL